MELVIIGIALLAIIGYWCFLQKKDKLVFQEKLIKEQQIIIEQFNEKKAELDAEILYKRDLNKGLEEEIAYKQNLKDNIENDYNTISTEYQNILVDFNVKKTNLENDLKNESQKEIENLQKIYYNIQQELYNKKTSAEKDIILLNKDINKLKEEQQIIINRRIQEEQENNKIEDYKLQLNEQQLNDLKILREVEYKISDKDSINKLIWKCSYEKPFNNLITKILKPSANKLIGIYKITNLDNGKSYIGQSVDLKERLRTHIKAGIGIDFKNNLLYNEMRKTDLTNFTFEIIEYCSRDELNDKEKFWIDYYLTNQYGLNMTKGGSSNC